LTVRLSSFDSSIFSGTSNIYTTKLSLTIVFHNFRIVLLADFTRVDDIQASRPYFSNGGAIHHVFIFSFVYRINEQKLIGCVSIIISRFTPSLAPLRYLHNRRVQLAYHQGTILNSPKLFCMLFTNLTARIYNRRHVYDTPHEYYSHDIVY
jgi:hypothetical protein